MANEIKQDNENESVYRMKINANKFVELMGGEVTLWNGNIEEGKELNNPQRITSELLEQLQKFIAFTESKKGKTK